MIIQEVLSSVLHSTEYIYSTMIKEGTILFDILPLKKKSEINFSSKVENLKVECRIKEVAKKITPLYSPFKVLTSSKSKNQLVANKSKPKTKEKLL